VGNRPKAAYPTSPNAQSKKVEFAHDCGGRRVRKTVYNYSGSTWSETADRLFVYDGWNVVMVLNANANNATVQKYTWGLDMSGLQGAAGVTRAGMDGSSGIHDAGGIGGLLALEKTTGTNAGSYWYLYDGNGNVMQLLNASTLDVAAVYEYDAYGNTLVAEDWDFSGIVDDNPFRFSTKWFDTELGTGHELYYYGYRYYSPRLGRWLSKDPIGEAGGLNVFAFLHNGTTAGIDPLGLDRWVVPFPGSAKTTSCLLRYQPLRHDALIYGSGSSCTQVEMGMETCRIQPGIHAVKDIVENVLRACCATTIGCSGRVTKTTVPCPTRPPDRKTTPQEDAELDKKYNDGDTVYYEMWFWNCQNFCKVASNPKFDK